MIDGMIGTLKKEQVDDNNKKEYCGTQMDSSNDKKKTLERSVSDLENAIATAEEGIATTTDEIAALEAGIKALDKSVAEATEQRKDQSAEYNELMANDAAAKELLLFAKNRLNKFYNPKLYNPPANEDEGGAVLVEIYSHKQRKDAPPPPPETFGPYTKSQEN